MEFERNRGKAERRTLQQNLISILRDEHCIHEKKEEKAIKRNN